MCVCVCTYTCVMSCFSLYTRVWLRKLISYHTKEKRARGRTRGTHLSEEAIDNVLRCISNSISLQNHNRYGSLLPSHCYPALLPHRKENDSPKRQSFHLERRAKRRYAYRTTTVIKMRIVPICHGPFRATAHQTAWVFHWTKKKTKLNRDATHAVFFFSFHFFFKFYFQLLWQC